MNKVRHKGRLAQTGIYLGKLLRMFVFQNDWKVLPMAAVITGVVTYVLGTYLFVTQEGTISGSFALVCVCIWNGFFNSIQSVCRERSIVKREHRSGMHISAYIAAQMIYQMLLCLAQTIITLVIFRLTSVNTPAAGIVTPWGLVDLGITIFLVTYAADMMALTISCLVRTTTTAMTVMPFLLIFQLVFSGTFFSLEGFAEKLTALTISRWGINGICAIGRYNQQPMVTLWNTIFKFRDVDLFGMQPLSAAIREVEERGYLNDFLLWSGKYNQNEAFASTAENVLQAWRVLGLIVIVCALASVIALKAIDRDKR